MSEKKNVLSDALKIRCMRNLETSQNSLSNLLLAAEYGKIKVFYDEDDRLLGYVAWASVNKESLNLMKRSPYLPRYPYEFDEGNIMVIFDAVLNRDFAKQARRLLVGFLKEKRFFAVLKKNKLRLWSKLNSKFKVSCYSSTPHFIAPKLMKKLILKNDFSVQKTIESSKISMVIPVKNNQLGINVLLDSIRANTPAASYPLEVIIVDNNSNEKVVVEGEYPFPVVMTRCETAGASAARNAGAALARGEWLLFTDSDCIATATTIAGYL